MEEGNPCEHISVTQSSPVLSRVIFWQVVEYLNDVIITLDSFVGAYPPAASILISAGHSRYHCYFGFLTLSEWSSFSVFSLKNYGD